jgi:D-serine deaminase-like pyridoxal phosphate-dependent protein
MQDQQLESAQQEQPQVELASTSSEVSTTRKRDYEYYKKIFDGRSMPFAFVDLDLLDQNIREIASRARGKHIRLASKSIRCTSILRRIFAADDCFQGIMCYTPLEAVYLASQGFEDLLIGYPAWNEHDLAAVARATKDGARITLMIDSIEHIERIEAIASQHGVRLPLCLEIDMSMDIPGLHFGVWRSPVRTVEQAKPIIERIKASSHVFLDGLMGYEAQIAGLGDNFPGQRAKNALVRRLKRRSIHEVAERRAAIVALIRSCGITPCFVNGGGTGSIDSTREEAVVTEITAGSGFYAPALFDNYRDFRYAPAAAYAIEIVRRPRPSLYTCLGGGYIASGSTGPEKQPAPYLPEGAKLLSLEGAGEVQTPIHYDGPLTLHFGDPIFMRHSKAGELCERFTHLYLVSDGRIVDKVTTYRGEGQCFI